MAWRRCGGLASRGRKGLWQ